MNAGFASDTPLNEFFIKAIRPTVPDVGMVNRKRRGFQSGGSESVILEDKSPQEHFAAILVFWVRLPALWTNLAMIKWAD